MTAPVPETIEREKDKLWVTDAELIRRMGVPEKVLRPMLPALESKYGFPEKQPLFGGRRYWPAVRRWCDENFGGSARQSASPHYVTHERREPAVPPLVERSMSTPASPKRKLTPRIPPTE